MQALCNIREACSPGKYYGCNLQATEFINARFMIVVRMAVVSEPASLQNIRASTENSDT